jgi:hypothetical protein
VALVGAVLGTAEGAAVGDEVGACVGAGLGRSVGECEGAGVGDGVMSEHEEAPALEYCPEEQSLQ